MLKRINHILKRFKEGDFFRTPYLFNEKFSQKPEMLKVKGQVAIVLILMAAIALIFFAVSLNLGKVAEIKTMTTVASNISAANMASSFASHSEQLYQVQLGGQTGSEDDLSVCGFTAIFRAILSIVIIVVVILMPGAAPLLAFVGLGLAIASLGIQLMFVQPGISRMWNKQMENMPPLDRFVENGIMLAFQNAVQDLKQVDDDWDMDMDGQYTASGGDKVSRFGYYYTERLKGIQAPIADPAVIEEFTTDLEEFLDWLIDPIDCEANPAHACCGDNPPAECNPCCVDQNVIDPRTGFSARPDCCDNPDPDLFCYSAGACTSQAYGGIMVGLDQGLPYPFVFNPALEDWTNAAQSYRERFGLDDEHKSFRVNPLPKRNINTRYDPQIPEPELPDGMWRIDDTKGNIFPEFYRLSDWGLDLGVVAGWVGNDFRRTRQLLDGDDVHRRYECHQCDPRHLGCGPNINALLSEPNSLLNDINPQLALTDDPAAKPNDFAGGYCVWDSFNDSFMQPDETALMKLKIVRPDLIKSLHLVVKPDNYSTHCGTPALRDADENIIDDFAVNWEFAKWKRGTDLYCKTQWPYNAQCPKLAGCVDDTGLDCHCEDPRLAAVDKNLWPDDLFDDFIHGSTGEFFDWAQRYLSMDDATRIQKFTEWYPSFQQWFAPSGAGEDFLNGDANGSLHLWRQAFNSWVGKINEWLNTPWPTQDCDQALCIPSPAIGISTSSDPAAGIIREVGTPPGQCPGLKDVEIPSFGTGQGFISDIKSCLEYNIENIIRFDGCGRSAGECTEANCQFLPRSVLINAPFGQTFDSNDFVVPYDAHVMRFKRCLDDPCAPGGQFSCINADNIGIPRSNTPWQNGPLGNNVRQNGLPNPIINNYPTRDYTDNPGPFGAELTTAFPGRGLLEPDWARKAALDACPITCEACRVAATCTFDIDACYAVCDFDEDGCYDNCTAEQQECHDNDCDTVMADQCPLDCADTRDNVCIPACDPSDPFCIPACDIQHDNCVNVICPQAVSDCHDACDAANGPCEGDCDDQATTEAECRADCEADLLACQYEERNLRNACSCIVNGETYNCIWHVQPEVLGNCDCPEPDFGACATNPQNPGDVACHRTKIDEYYDCLLTQVCPPIPLAQDPPVENTPPDCCSIYRTAKDSAPGECRFWNLGNVFYEMAVQSWELAKGNCLDTDHTGAHGGQVQRLADNTNYGDWQPKLQDSGTEGGQRYGLIFQEKLQKRLDFLEFMMPADDADNDIIKMRNFFTEAYGDPAKPIDKILASANNIINERRRVDDLVPLPEYAVYGWQSDPPKNSPEGTRGRWHIVRVDMRVPTRCGGNCVQGDNAGIPEPKLSTVKTYTRAWATRRCYSLGDSFDITGSQCVEKSQYDDDAQCFRGGVVKSQVIRWDEDKQKQLKFANDMDIWKFKFYHPEAGRTLPPITTATLDNLATECPPDPRNPSADGAFMLNRREDQPACWDRVNQILDQGMMSRTCAEYYFHQFAGNATPPVERGFGLKFVPCTEPF